MTCAPGVAVVYSMLVAASLCSTQTVQATWHLYTSQQKQPLSPAVLNFMEMASPAFPASVYHGWSCSHPSSQACFFRLSLQEIGPAPKGMEARLTISG